MMVNLFSRYETLEPDTHVSRCHHCSKMMIWHGGTIIYPATLLAPLAHDDLPEPALATYVEARSIFSPSPRASAALLRLCLEQLISTLDTGGRDLNDSVKRLVANGLPVRVQQAMDSVRLIGNEAVHPGVIQLNDDPATALSMFDLVNLIVDFMITRPRMVEDVYARLPEDKRAAVERRDGGDGK